MKNDKFMSFTADLDLLKLAIGDYQVNFDMPLDARVEEMNGFLGTMDKVTSGTSSNDVVRAMGKFNTVMDRFMWGHLMSSMKIRLVEKFEAGLDQTQDPALLAMKRQEAGRWINDIVGGQGFEELGINKNLQQAMRMLMLSPDWVVSSFRHFGSMGSELFPIMKNMAGGDPYLTIDGKKAQADVAKYKGQLARAHWVKGAFMIYSAMTLANMASRTLWPMDDKDKQAPVWTKGMWSNDIGHRLGVYFGSTKDGGKIYINPLKAYMEIPELIMDHTGTGPLGLRLKLDAAVERLGAKASPVISSVIASFTGVEPGGFKDDIYGAKGMEHVGDIAKRLARVWLPYSAGNVLNPSMSPAQKIISFATQTQRGANPRGVVDMYEQALDMMASGNEAGARDLIRQTSYAALNNGLDAKKFFVVAQDSWKSDQAKKSNMGIESIEDVKQKLTQPMSVMDRQALLKKMRNIQHQSAAMATKEAQSAIIMNDYQRLARLTNTHVSGIRQQAQQQLSKGFQPDENQ